MRRREFLKQSLAAAAATSLVYAADGWKDVVPGIISRIRPPQFPDRDFNIRPFADGSANSRPAILKAIDECHAAGGGRVVLGAGEHLSNGPLHLKSNVNFHLAEGAHLRFGTNPADYLPPCSGPLGRHPLLQLLPAALRLPTGKPGDHRPGRNRRPGSRVLGGMEAQADP